MTRKCTNHKHFPEWDNTDELNMEMRDGEPIVFQSVACECWENTYTRVFECTDEYKDENS